MRTIYPIVMLAIGVNCVAFDIVCAWKGAATPHSNYGYACILLTPGAVLAFFVAYVATYLE